MKTLLGIVAVTVALAVPAARPHHSFAAEFDADKPVKLTGTVTKVQWRNPHTYFYVDVPDDKGVVHNWAMELGSPNGLTRRGWTRETLKIGDTITVEGSRARDVSFKANASNVTLQEASASSTVPTTTTPRRRIRNERTRSANRHVRPRAAGRRHRGDRFRSGCGSRSWCGQPAAPPEPTPRLADGTVDLGGNGIWELPWVTNLEQARHRREDQAADAGRDSLSALGAGDEGVFGQDEERVRPAGLLPAARHPACVRHTVPGAVHPAEEPHRGDLRRRRAHLARDLHGWAPAPEGFRAVVHGARDGKWKATRSSSTPWASTSART